MTGPRIGRYFDELDVGDAYEHAITKTITETDNSLFCALTYNSQPLHIDEHFSRTSIHGTRIVNGIFIVGVVLGVSVPDLTLGTLIANLSLTDIEFPHPVRIGDTVRSESVVLSKRESRSRPNAGIVEFETRGFNQDNVMVVKVRRSALMLKRAVPTQLSGGRT